MVGATGGVGEPIARRLALEGMHVVLSARNKDKLEALSSDTDGNTYVFSGDSSEIEDVKNLFKYSSILGDIKLVVVCAGEWSELEDNLSLEEILGRYNVYRKVFLDALFNVALVAKDYIQKQDEGGTLIHFSSHVVYKLLEGNLLYAPVKHGASAFMKNLDFELRSKGDEKMRLVDFQPGAMQTPAMRKWLEKKYSDSPDKIEAMFASFTPMSLIADAVVESATKPLHELELVRRFD